MKVPNLQGKWEETQLQTMTQLLIELQNNLSDEGFRIPQQPTKAITQINFPNGQPNPNAIGGIIYDSDTNELKVNINGVVKVIQVV